MKGVLFGGVVFCLGLLSLVCGIYYGWIVVTPGVDPTLIERYRLAGSVFTYLSFGLMLGGVVFTILSVRKVNRRDRLDRDKGGKS